MIENLSPCPYCKDSWVHAGDYDYGSDCEAFGYTVNCMCGYAWRNRRWHDTIEAALDDWNKRCREHNDSPSCDRDRDRLIALLSGHSLDTAEDVEYVADWLMQNGVIIKC